MSKEWLIGLGSWVLLTLAVACSPGPKEPPQAPPSDRQPIPPPSPYQLAPGNAEPDEERDITTPDEAEDVFSEEQTELDKLLEAGPTPEGMGASRCTRLCNSLRSMRRAVTSLCEMTGDDDERCQDARERLKNNERRIAEAGCSC